ncbi:uncharacterized protein LOC144880284 [Branchiostoma floridae x Branchiostoma japonicum]
MQSSEMALIASKQLLEDLLQELQTNNKDLSVREARESLNKSLGLDGCGPGLSAEEQRLQASRWLSWARQKHQLKVVTAAVPQLGISPDLRTAELHDVRVFTKHGPDDAVYDSNKEFREKVARGNSFLEIPAGPDRGTYCVIHALKKFTGGLGDDDDKDKGDNHTWKKYFTKPLEEATTVVATRKANGEAAHLGARLVGGKVVLCGGSKNVHMLFTQRGHIEKYKESRYQVAREVCTAIMDLLDDMSDLHRHRLLSFLVHTGYTAVFEVLQPHHQHVEDLSYLKRSELRFIAWTSTDLEPRSNSQLCSMAPHMAIEIARTMGMPTVQYELVPASEVETHMKQIRQGYGYEGEVLYFLDADGAVIGLLKKKTIWYIVIRAIREKVRNAAQAYTKKNDFDINRSDKKLRQRIGEIQQWLGLDEDSVATWRELGHKFLHWVINNLRTRTVTMEEVSGVFPVVWNRFLSDTGLSDHVTSQWEEPEGSDD